jgi:AraC-like DNA-binding protein
MARRSTATQHASTDHALLSPLAAQAFQVLGLGATLVRGRKLERWDPIYISEFNVMHFEFEHAGGAARSRYNKRCAAKVYATGKAVLGEHAGFHDLFVPVTTREGERALLVCGPFSRRRPGADEIREGWRSLTGRTATLADASFAQYAQTSRETLVLTASWLALFRTMMRNFASLIGGGGDVDRLAKGVQSCVERLRMATHDERVWTAAEGLVDPRTSRSWQSSHRRAFFHELGIERLPTCALVGLMVDDDAPASDDLEAYLRSDSLQRTAVRLSAALSDALAGRVGRYGVFLLAPNEPRRARRASHLQALAQRLIRTIRREVGARLVVGMTASSDAAALPEVFQRALAAAQRGLLEGIDLVVDKGEKRAGSIDLLRARSSFEQAMETAPDRALAAEERWAQAVVARYGSSVECVRGYLAASIERLALLIERSQTLDLRSFESWVEGVEHDLVSATTLRDAVAIHHRAAADAARALLDPKSIRAEYRLRRALAYIQERFTGPLTQPGVARMVGLAPASFSRLFASQTGKPFSRYVLSLRLEHARRLLETSELSVSAVARLSGFRSPFYFHHAFTRAFRTTPRAYRAA